MRQADVPFSSALPAGSEVPADEIDAIKRALRETVQNLERVVEQGERALSRAREQLDRFGD